MTLGIDQAVGKDKSVVMLRYKDKVAYSLPLDTETAIERAKKIARHLDIPVNEGEFSLVLNATQQKIWEDLKKKL